MDALGRMVLDELHRQEEMMAKRIEYVVRVRIAPGRVALSAKEIDGAFLECLRYAHVIDLHWDEEDGQCFDICCPAGLNSKTWATMNSSRMRTFGYNAEAATVNDKPQKPERT